MLDILAFAAHPDDVELSCSGVLLKSIAQGKTAGIVDLTRGELGTRGTTLTRAHEAEAANAILGIKVRENLGFRDGFFQNDEKHQLEIIRMIRQYKPTILFANAMEDRHPDHGRAARLVADSAFLSGLRKIETRWEGVLQEPHRPQLVLHYIQDRYIQPDFVVDITDFVDKKMECVKAFQTQFHDPKSKEPATYISSGHFLEGILARASEFGRSIGVRYAEGFTSERTIGVEDVFSLR